MGYRRLLAKYMRRVNNQSGSIWLDEALDEALTPRDVSELRSIWQMIEREEEFNSSRRLQRASAGHLFWARVVQH